MVPENMVGLGHEEYPYPYVLTSFGFLWLP
jgi:hypothetical protein